MDETQVGLHTDLLTRIHEQLDRRQAGELAFFASDDTVLFCASVLAKVSSGALTLTTEQLAFVRQGLRGLRHQSDPRLAPNSGSREA